MPEPRKGEKKSSYISRAISYMVRVEGMKRDHAVAKAYGMWRQHLKRRSPRKKGK